MLACSGSDGSISCLTSRRSSRKQNGRDSRTKPIGGLKYASEVMATKTDLEERRFAIQEKRSKLEELQLHNEYQLRLKDMSSSEKLKEVGEKYQQDREAGTHALSTARGRKGGGRGRVRAAHRAHGGHA